MIVKCICQNCFWPKLSQKYVSWSVVGGSPFLFLCLAVDNQGLPILGNMRLLVALFTSLFSSLSDFLTFCITILRFLRLSYFQSTSVQLCNIQCEKKIKIMKSEASGPPKSLGKNIPPQLFNREHLKCS